MKVAVLTDSTSDIYDMPHDIEGLYKIPMQISTGEETFLDSVTITRDEVYDMMEEGKIFQTSLPAVGEIEKLFEKIIEDGYDVIYAVVMSSGLSSTVHAMAGAAKTVGIEFHNFDLYSGAEIELLYAKAAREMFDKGFSIDKVNERLTEAREFSSTYIVADDLKHLMRSGRLSPAAAILGGLLRIKPVMYLGMDTGGKLVPVAKPRTMRRALENIVERYVEDGVDKDSIIYVVHIRNLEMANKLKEMIIERFGEVEVSVKELVIAVSIHIGLGGVATQFSKKINVN